MTARPEMTARSIARSESIRAGAIGQVPARIALPPGPTLRCWMGSWPSPSCSLQRKAGGRGVRDCIANPARAGPSPYRSASPAAIAWWPAMTSAARTLSGSVDHTSSSWLPPSTMPSERGNM